MDMIQLIESFENIADSCIIIAKELSKSVSKELKNKKGKMSQKKGVNEEMQKGSLSYRKKEKRWMGRWREFGKEKCLYAKTQKECAKLLKEAVKDFERRKMLAESKDVSKNDNIVDETMTINEWFDFWFNYYKKPLLKERSQEMLKVNYNANIKDAIGEKKINRITEDELRDFLDNLKNNNRKRQSYRILNEMFDILKERNLVKINPLKLIVLSLEKEKKPLGKEKTALSLEQERTLFKVLEKTKFYDYCDFLLYSGMRRDEGANVDINDLDFEKEIIKIPDSKTESGIRIIPMFPRLKTILERVLNDPERDKSQTRVFYDIKTDSVSTTFKYHAEKVGINASLHTLRHTFITRCFEAKIEPKVVQGWVGHKDYSTTINVYTHVSKDKENQEIAKLNTFLNTQIDTQIA